MDVSRKDGVGWTAAALAAFGALIILINALDIDFWFFAALNAIPTIFGVIVLACAVAVLLTGLFGGRD